MPKIVKRLEGMLWPEEAGTTFALSFPLRFVIVEMCSVRFGQEYELTCCRLFLQAEQVPSFLNNMGQSYFSQLTQDRR